ncbi:metallophosphoesterase [Massilia sp. R2A-15]|uniref:metallophosphoesterase family protein n=1 Tax=Massilia sp. R2A-15 TaxID=3064278 RepID=UPI002732C7CD|nr:metallophosphoesterase [Massilia sp. R2A-15]WLI90850.1 metallophosphoesterase [Massilia sp. R2A-15]
MSLFILTPLRGALLAVSLALAGCAAPVRPPAMASFVVLGEDGAAVARVVTQGAACPSIRFDQRDAAMAVRAPAATIAQRPTESAPADSKPGAFPVLTCEAPIPAGTAQATVNGHALPLPRAQVNRIVVIGDTGCRLKKNSSGPEYQDCNLPAAFPFARVAALAADWRPDLVVHVGDYHYRESACPADRPGCAGSPWGYGWDAWDADFFTPARKLLDAAPWVVARGNHESCTRAGQGWWRFLDPRLLLAGRDCNDAANDMKGNFSDPYAVPLGAGAQLIVLDTSATSYKGLAAGDPRMARYGADYRKMDELTRRAPYSIAVDHHPLLGFGAVRNKAGEVRLFGGDKGLQDAYGAVDPGMMPKGVKALLSGHVHLWEQVSFSSEHPTQFVSGFSGTAEDIVPLPETLAPQDSPAPGAVVASISSWIDGFGYMTMERAGADAWTVRVWDLDGKLRNTCAVTGSKSLCEIAHIR